MGIRNDLRNIAVVAHADHGRTTLADQLLRRDGIFRVSEAVAERVMDSNDLERERGITISSKNTTVIYGGVKINVIDTPGHAGSGNEVGCILMIIDGALLSVDAFENYMSRVHFVLKKALGLSKKPMVIASKIDHLGARPLEVMDEVLGLFIELGMDESQPEFPVMYASGHDGYATPDPDKPRENMAPLFGPILKFVPIPQGDLRGPAQVLFSNVGYDGYPERIGTGRVERDRTHDDQSVMLCGHEGGNCDACIMRLYQFEGLKRVEITETALGDIVAVSGITGLNIGETACAPDRVEPLPFVRTDEPTVSAVLVINNGPFTSKEGKLAISRSLRDRLFKEVEVNVALRVGEADSAGTFKVSGRGEPHLSIPIETMRRQNYEFQASRPSVICKMIGDKRCEPIELLITEMPDQYVGAVMEKLGSREVEIVNMGTRESGMTHMESKVPVRGLVGYHSEFLADVNGDGIMNHVSGSYEPYRGDIIQRAQSSLVAHETGLSTAYGLFYAQDRDKLFISAGVEVCEGMIAGANPKQESIAVNICEKKYVANTRVSSSDDTLELISHMMLSLEQSLEFITEDGLVEVISKLIRMRKMILSKEQYMKQSNGKK